MWQMVQNYKNILGMYGISVQANLTSDDYSKSGQTQLWQKFNPDIHIWVHKQNFCYLLSTAAADYWLYHHI